MNMTMEIVEGQRFPQQFVRTLFALGACAALFTLFRLPFAQLSFTVVLLMLLAVQVSSRFDRGAGARDGWHFPSADAFIFLAMLLFDGEVAVLLAALVAACAALAERKSAQALAFRAALAATAAFIVVWALRLSSDVITEITTGGPPPAVLEAACIAVLTLSFIRAAVTTLGVSYRINQSPWRAGARAFFWQLVGNSAAFAAALLAAVCVRSLGANASVGAGAVACLLASVAGAFFSGEKPATPAGEAREKASENDRFRSAFDYAAIGMALVSTEGRWLQVNRSLCQILGYSEKELLTTDFLAVTHPDDLPTALSNIGQLLRGKVQASQMEKRYINKSGHEVWVHWSVSMVRDQYSKSVHLIFQIQDITDRKLAEQQLHHDAFHDALTGLPNRALFMDHLKLAIARSRRNSSTTFAVLYLDLYRAKTLGKARYEIFDKAMHARAINLLQMETDMRRALEREEFILHYQPIVSLENFRLRGFEALVRWQHPQRGFISPMDFIPVAEETGMIIQLGEWVLREACGQMQRRQRIFPLDHPLSVAVNLSSKQFSQTTLISKVAMILQETGVNPHTVKLEITESVVMENIDTATDMLRQLRGLGVKLAIDDFGTGYSSLSYLHRFPIDTLKIDRSFVTRMSENNENTEIVRTIVVLAQNLGMDVIAEGVETNEQLVLLQKLGCENGQGYFFSKPVNSDGAEKIIAETYGSLISPLRQHETQPGGKRVLVA